MKGTQTISTSNIISLGWDTIANWGIGIITALTGFIIWLVKIIIDLLFKNWRNSREELEKRVAHIELEVTSIKDIELVCVSKKDKSKTPINEKVSQIAHKIDNLDAVFTAKLLEVIESIDNLNNNKK